MWYRRVAACRACGRVLSVRCRGLCAGCYGDPGTRERFPTVSKYAFQGPAQTGEGLGSPDPTRARPGTEAKVVELERRVVSRQELWHPRDATADLD